MKRFLNSATIVLVSSLVIAWGAILLVERIYGQDAYTEIKAFFKEYEKAWGKKDGVERISKLVHEDAKITSREFGTVDKAGYLDILPRRFQKYPYIDFKVKKKNLKLTENGADLILEIGVMLQTNMNWYYGEGRMKLVRENGKWLLMSTGPK